MAVLSFSVTADATARISEVLICLAKFGDTVAIEARREKARQVTYHLPNIYQR
jgi:cell cycle checkpoint control protein RAD9A